MFRKPVVAVLSIIFVLGFGSLCFEEELNTQSSRIVSNSELEIVTSGNSFPVSQTETKPVNSFTNEIWADELARQYRQQEGVEAGFLDSGEPQKALKSHDPSPEAAAKISPGLKRILNTLESEGYQGDLPVIVQLKAEEDVQQSASLKLNEPKTLLSINGFSGSSDIDGIWNLAENYDVAHISIDAPIRATTETVSGINHATTTIGLGQDGNYYGPVNNEIGFDGDGVTVAVFDSGIHGHVELSSSDNPDMGNDKTIYNVDFTSGSAQSVSWFNDGYGHGTHVAGIIAAKGRKNPEYSGVGPALQLLDLRVLDETGTGSTSNLISAIDWLIVYKEKFQVRVANLSLGHPALESYATDPLCVAVRSMVEAGIVTVVSAGNMGSDENHPELWGGISSPGMEPSVITVGAVNTKGTATREDDVATTYSSRGFTQPDELFKPDLVAPGNSIVSLAAENSYIATHYPSLVIQEGSYMSDYLVLSGSSMATPFVAGTAALMLQANPDLEPIVVKTILLLTATKMDNLHPFEQGNGFLNALTAIRMAEQINTEAQQLDGSVDPNWVLQGEYGPEEVWSGGAFICADRVFYSGLANPDADIWGDGVIWSDHRSVIWSDWANDFFEADSVVWSDTKSVVWSDSKSVVWSDSAVWGDSVVWSDSRSVVWSDTRSVVWSDARSVVWSDAFLGDD